MFDWALASLEELQRSCTVVIALEEHEQSAGVSEIVRQVAGSDSQLILLPEVTEGQLCTVLSAALGRMPQHAFLYQKLGQTLRGLGKLEESLSVFDAGLSRHPQARELRDGRWSCLDKLGRLEALLIEAERAVASDPGDGMARYARALACCKAEGATAYRVALQREMAQLPGDPLLEAAWGQLTHDPPPR